MAEVIEHSLDEPARKNLPKCCVSCGNSSPTVMRVVQRGNTWAWVCSEECMEDAEDNYGWKRTGTSYAQSDPPPSGEPQVGPTSRELAGGTSPAIMASFNALSSEVAKRFDQLAAKVESVLGQHQALDVHVRRVSDWPDGQKYALKNRAAITALEHKETKERVAALERAAMEYDPNVHAEVRVRLDTHHTAIGGIELRLADLEQLVGLVMGTVEKLEREVFPLHAVMVDPHTMTTLKDSKPIEADPTTEIERAILGSRRPWEAPDGTYESYRAEPHPKWTVRSESGDEWLRVTDDTPDVPGDEGKAWLFQVWRGANHISLRVPTADLRRMFERIADRLGIRPLPPPELTLKNAAKAAGLPTYHQTLEKFCSMFSVPGSPTMDSAFARVATQLTNAEQRTLALGEKVQKLEVEADRANERIDGLEEDAATLREAARTYLSERDALRVKLGEQNAKHAATAAQGVTRQTFIDNAAYRLTCMLPKLRREGIDVTNVFEALGYPADGTREVYRVVSDGTRFYVTEHDAPIPDGDEVIATFSANSPDDAHHALHEQVRKAQA